MLVKLCNLWPKAIHYWSFEGKKTMNLHNDAVLANIIVKFTSRNYEDSVSCIVHKLFVKRYY